MTRVVPAAQAKLSYAQVKEQVDALKRDNTRLGTIVSEVKTQLANAKANHEDMEATCAHALSDRQAALREIDALKRAAKSPGFFGR